MYLPHRALNLADVLGPVGAPFKGWGAGAQPLPGAVGGAPGKFLRVAGAITCSALATASSFDTRTRAMAVCSQELGVQPAL